VEDYDMGNQSSRYSGELDTSVLQANALPGDPEEPGVPDLPTEPGVPMEPDQPPPAPIV